MEVRERIRINGLPISKELFAKYFFEVWDRLEASKALHTQSKRNEMANRLGNENEKLLGTSAWDKPGYFRYLTLMALHVFKREEV